MKEGRDRKYLSSVTEFLVVAQCIYFYFFGHIANIGSVGPNFILLGFLIAVFPLIFVGVWLCKLLVDFVNQKLKIEDLTKYRNDYLIGFGTIGICTVVLEVLVFSAELSIEFHISACYIYVNITYMICYFFVFPTFDKKCTWIDIDHETTQKYIFTSFICHVALSFVPFQTAAEYDSKEMRTIIAYQYWCNLAIVVTFAEFARVLCHGVRLINVNGETNKISAKPDPKPISKVVAPKPNCNICSFPSTETGIHTPRQIKECGHTICEQCAGKLVNAKVQNFLICPFCQKPTVVNGPAGTLPKNYALLEYRRDVVQQ